MNVVPVACLSDNYAYLLIGPATANGAACMIVDPSEGEPVIAALANQKTRDGKALHIAGILCTHHHPDHVGGVEALVDHFSVKDVYGFESDRGRIPRQTHFLKNDESFAFEGMTIRAIHIPGHTLGAVAYVVTEPGQDPVAFTGDTLFVGGCGRVFEGDAEMMHASLSKLAALEPKTRVYCGHEYTESNYRFAATLEPSNLRLEQARERASSLRQAKKPTVPTTIEEELATNPFLRVTSGEIRKALKLPEGASNVDVFAKTRTAKDNFRPSAPLQK